jgi:hypothetical protein
MFETFPVAVLSIFCCSAVLWNLGFSTSVTDLCHRIPELLFGATTLPDFTRHTYADTDPHLNIIKTTVTGFYKKATTVAYDPKRFESHTTGGGLCAVTYLTGNFMCTRRWVVRPLSPLIFRVVLLCDLFLLSLRVFMLYFTPAKHASVLEFCCIQWCQQAGTYPAEFCSCLLQPFLSPRPLQLRQCIRVPTSAELAWQEASPCH